MYHNYEVFCNVFRYNGRCKLISVRFNFLPYRHYKKKYYCTPTSLLEYIEKRSVQRVNGFSQNKLIVRIIKLS